MRPAIDHEPFNALLDRLADIFGKRLTPPVRQAYWDALKHHHLSEIEQRAKSHIGHGKHFPRPVEITPETSRTTPAATAEDKPASKYDVLHIHAQQVMFSFLRHQPTGASHASLDRMIEAKNKLVADYRWIVQDEPQAASELRDKLIAAFQAAYEPTPQAELDAAVEVFQRTGRVPDRFANRNKPQGELQC